MFKNTCFMIGGLAITGPCSEGLAMPAMDPIMAAGIPFALV